MSAPKSSLPMVDYTQFNPALVTSLSPNEKSWTKDLPDGKKETGKYKEVPLLYQYPVEGGQHKSDKIYIQFPEVTIPNGIKEDSKNNFPSYSVMVVFDQTNPEHVRTVNQVLYPFYFRIAELLAPVKGQLGPNFVHFNPKAPQGILADLVYTARDKVSGEAIPGKDPTQFYKMYKNTPFSDLSGRAIDHNILKNANITGYPLICFSHVYAGTKLLVKSHLQSFVVTGVKKSDNMARQLVTIEHIRASNPNAVTDLEAQIAKLMGDVPDSMFPPASQKTGPGTETMSLEHQLEAASLQHSSLQLPSPPSGMIQESQFPLPSHLPPPSQLPPSTVYSPVLPAANSNIQAFLAQSHMQPRNPGIPQSGSFELS